MEEPVGTPPSELEEGGPINEFNPLQKQSNSVCSRDRHDIHFFFIKRSNSSLSFFVDLFFIFKIFFGPFNFNVVHSQKKIMKPR